MTDKTHQDPVTLLRALVDLLEKEGHRDMAEVIKAREYLTSVAPKEADKSVVAPHNK